jgi:antitoxin (DNA-binding transcriptional repressor) of toxin-antitoxin stability system
MRQVSAQLLDPESLVELKSGHRLELVQGGRTIAEIVPVLTEEAASEGERAAAVKRFTAWMDKGIDLKGLRIDRDELYDRV